MKRILVADDHVMVSEAICSILEKNYEVAGIAKDGRELVEKAFQLRPDVIVLDISMPELNGIEACRQLQALGCTAKVVFVTQQLGSEYVRAAFDAGAMGYVAKQSASSELLQAVRLALMGRYYVTPLVASGPDNEPAPKIQRSNPAEMFGARLTGRQREVLQLVAEGKTTKEIAAALNISVKTVEFHRSCVMDQLGLRTTAELTRYALIHGVIA
jgi:DNA-binding NarL/FixJ family response regulator